MTPAQQGLDQQRSLPTPFLSKTYQLVDDSSIDDIISWNEDGSGFIVWNPTEFAGDLLPKYFKHNNFSSFVRQLNTYGFRKIVPDRWEFSNERFRRGEKRLLRDIQRRKITLPAATAAPAAPAAAAVVAVAPAPLVGSRSPSDSAEEQVVSSNSPPMVSCRDHSSSSGCSTELTDENERLRRENMQLNRELSRMKSLCSNIYDLMSNYASNRPEIGSPPVTPLDLLTERRQQCENDVTADGTSLPVVESRSVAKSFGFPIGAKRPRGCDDVDENFLELQLRLGGMDVKSEPSDQVNGGDDPGCTWVGGRSDCS